MSQSAKSRAEKLLKAREAATQGEWTDYPAHAVAGRAIVAPAGPAVFPNCWDVKTEDSQFVALAANETAWLARNFIKAIEALESIAAEKCSPSFDSVLKNLDRGKLISIIDTDTALARQVLAQMEEK